ncbi:Calcium/proton exchanger, partial [Aureobasidium melanogenum]
MMLWGNPQSFYPQYSLPIPDSMLDQYSCAPNLYSQSTFQNLPINQYSYQSPYHHAYHSLFNAGQRGGQGSTWPLSYGVDLNTGLTTDLTSYQMPGTHGQVEDQAAPVSDSTDSSGSPQQHRLMEDLLGAPDRTKTDNSDPARSNTGDTMKKRRPKIGIVSQFKTTLLGSWVDVLLVCVPVGFALRYTHANGYAVFIVNFLAIISLAAMLSFATEELALYTGETLGGLLNASFGNATELIVSIIALAQNKILILQTSLIGSMRSNSLLVLGMCFSFGGINRLVQHFNVAVAQTASSMLAVLIGSLIIPTAFQRLGNNPAGGVAPISRGTAIILLLVYFAYLIFQLKTHVEIYNTLSQRNKKNRRSTRENGGTLMGIARIGAGTAASADITGPD